MQGASGAPHRATLPVIWGVTASASKVLCSQGCSVHVELCMYGGEKAQKRAKRAVRKRNASGKRRRVQMRSTGNRNSVHENLPGSLSLCDELNA